MFCLSTLNCLFKPAKASPYLSVAASASPAALADSIKASTNKPTAITNAPIPVDIRAALNVWAPVAPAVNPACI
jgi:hypothetical protein